MFQPDLSATSRSMQLLMKQIKEQPGTTNLSRDPAMLTGSPTPQKISRASINDIRISPLRMNGIGII